MEVSVLNVKGVRWSKERQWTIDDKAYKTMDYGRWTIDEIFNPLNTGARQHKENNKI